MSDIVFKEGDILYAEEDYICHQCNCVTVKSKGLSSQIFTNFPETDTYKYHSYLKSTPGTIKIFHRLGIINMFAQYQPGKVVSEKQDRVMWFKRCLDKILKHTPENSSFAFPYGIGCGLAGGDWKTYLALLRDFSKHRNVVIYKL